MMPSNGFIRTRRPAAGRGLPGAGLRASSVRGAQRQSIARSAIVNCCNAAAVERDTAAGLAVADDVVGHEDDGLKGERAAQTALTLERYCWWP